jgi:hypothetical protein
MTYNTLCQRISFEKPLVEPGLLLTASGPQQTADALATSF